MAQQFEIAKDLEVDATPEQVWEAIATGPGLDSWFMGRSDIEPREGGAAHWSIGGYSAESTVTAWDPPTHFVNTQQAAPDGGFHQFEYLIEAGENGAPTRVRYIHTGMLTGDWEAEYEAMSEGDPMYLQKLVEYVTYFSGRFGIPVDVIGPTAPDRDEAASRMRHALGLAADVAVGDEVTLMPDGMEPVAGVIDHVSPSFLGLRSTDALYRFIYGYSGETMVGHHLFAEGADQAASEAAWLGWLTQLFGG